MTKFKGFFDTSGTGQTYSNFAVAGSKSVVRPVALTIQSCEAAELSACRCDMARHDREGSVRQVLGQGFRAESGRFRVAKYHRNKNRLVPKSQMGRQER